MQDLQDAEAKGFASRRAEHASLAEGYFGILAPSYREQRGQEALQEAEAAFAALRNAARSGQSAAGVLPAVERVLHGFRAAPLSPEEQGRRAGQLRRFLGLVPVAIW